MPSGCCGRGERSGDKKPEQIARPKPFLADPAAAPRAGAGAGPGGAAGPPAPKQLLRAAKDGDAARIEELLEQGLDIEHRGMWANTPLLCACAYGSAEAAEVLVRRGADCTVANDDGATPLMLACMEGLDAAAVAMLGQGVELWPAAATVYNPVADSSEAQTPLRAACQNGRADLVRALLGRGALEGAPAPAAVASALVAAAKHGHEEIVEILLGAGVAADARDENGDTAAAVGTVEVKDLLAKQRPALSMDSARGVEPAAPLLPQPPTVPKLAPALEAR